MGAAIADYHKHIHGEKLRVFSPDFEEDEIPVDTLFRTLSLMPQLEREALTLASGHTLDVGAGAGCHSLALQAMGREVTAIDISPLSVKVMRERGVKDAREQDFWRITEKYDTILMLMNGIGIVGSISRMPEFFRHADRILSPGGQIIVDSTDISYIYEDEDGSLLLPADRYYGELEYTMQYRSVKGKPFPWLYIDFHTLANLAAANGFKAELVAEGDHYDYLARITRQ